MTIKIPQRVGHLFQGRFKALVIQDDAGWQEVAWSRMVSAVEQAKGESWVQFSPRRGDWGREGALWLGRRLGQLTPAQ